MGASARELPEGWRAGGVDHPRSVDGSAGGGTDGRSTQRPVRGRPRARAGHCPARAIMPPCAPRTRGPARGPPRDPPPPRSRDRAPGRSSLIRAMPIVAGPIIGMVHLGALPGSPRWSGRMGDVLSAALADAHAWATAGADALLVENHGDVPFTPERVDAASVAAMAVAVAEIRRAVDRPVGVNVLKSDALSALAVAAATGASFVRVNVHVGAVVTD